MQKIICLGMANVDVVATGVDGLNPNGDTTFSGSIQMVTGGDALNTAIQLKNAGASVAFAGTLGNDTAGDFLLRSMEGMDTSGVVRTDKCQSALCMALVGSRGQRHFVYNPGANLLTGGSNITDALLAGAGVLHVGGIMQMPALEKDLPALFEKARTKGVLTSMDVTFDSEGKWYEKIDGALVHTDYFMPSIAEARLICHCDTPEQVRDFFAGHGMKALVVKLGEKGCYVTDFEKEMYLRTYPTTVVDTTGAGDAFCAGFLAAIAGGESCFTAAAIGNVVSSVCVSALGAAAGGIAYEEARRKAKEYYHL